MEALHHVVLPTSTLKRIIKALLAKGNDHTPKEAKRYLKDAENLQTFLDLPDAHPAKIGNGVPITLDPNGQYCLYFGPGQGPGTSNQTPVVLPTKTKDQPYNRNCSVCDEPQFLTPSGETTCKNGHGGAFGVCPFCGEESCYCCTECGHPVTEHDPKCSHYKAKDKYKGPRARSNKK